MKVDSQEFTDLMKKWSDEAWAEEMNNAKEDYLANEDMHGRLQLYWSESLKKNVTVPD